MNRLSATLTVTVCALLATRPVDAQEAGAGVPADYYAGEAQTQARQATPAAVLELAKGREPLRLLPPAPEAEPQRLERLQQWNQGVFRGSGRPSDTTHRAGKRALQNGFERPFSNPHDVSFGIGARQERSVAGKEQAQQGRAPAADRAEALTVWSETVEVERASQLRLKLTTLDVAAGTQFWVANEAGELYGPFGTELMDVHGTLWTPSVYGERITLIAATPATTGGASFRIASVAELFELDAQGQPKLEANPKNDLPCAEDAQCIGTSSFSTIEETQSAIGSYTFVSGGSSFVCSGGLVNDTDTETFIPYFLTANHCLSTGAEASTVEVVWDYYASSCNGSAPSRGSLPRSNGATLLRTGEFADFTFLRLSNVPGGRWFMGWETGRSAISNGTVLHRVSHPGGGPQVYSRTAVSSPPPFSCSGLPTSNYIYSSQLQGGTAGGSSGAPVLLDNGRIVGQFFGDCGENIDDNCDYDNLAVDGALASFFGEIATYLETDSSGAADLAVTEVTGPGGAVAPGASFDVATTVENIGGQPSNAYRLTFYLSSDRNIGSSDRSLGFVDRESLGPGERHARVTTVTAPGDLAPGRYYVGVVISGGDSNASNDTRSDATPLDVGGGGGSVSVTPALNGAWFNPPTAGQGLLIEVYPGIGKVFMAWFTFDTTQPGNAASATIGAAGHRWLTGLGDIDGNRVQFDVALTQGALFNQVEPAAETTTGFGTVVIEFASCGSATLTYIFPGAGRSGSIDLQRITSDSVSNCQTIQGIYGQ